MLKIKTTGGCYDGSDHYRVVEMLLRKLGPARCPAPPHAMPRGGDVACGLGVGLGLVRCTARNPDGRKWRESRWPQVQQHVPSARMQDRT